MNRRAAVIAVGALLLAGCGSSEPAAADAPSADTSIRVEYVRVGDRTVPCILWDATGNGGLAMSCDWAVRS
jgi:type IV pilus biogenesis protein CpaD/CtpE